MIFADTNAIIALAVETDEFHQKAINFRNKNEEFVSSNLIFIELMGWLRYKAGRKLAIDTGLNLLSGKGIRLERVTLDDEKKAWELFQKTDGRSLSMIDCTTSILMRRLKIHNIFTFDEDFKTLGFNVLPG